MTRSAVITVLIVAYQPNPREIGLLLERVLEAKIAIPCINVSIIHNDDQSLSSIQIKRLYQDLSDRGLAIQSSQANGNLGFGRGINKLALDCTSPFLLILNQDAIPQPGALEKLANVALSSPPNVAAWEMRQIPYEHPKLYHPATMETSWASGAALLVRSAAFKDVGGFEPRIFLYGEDVDLSWKMRAKGWRILYVANAAVVHQTYSDPNKSKPLQVIGAIYAGLALRTRYSGYKQVVQGLSMALGELLLPRQEFPGRRRAISRAILKFLGDYSYFRSTSPIVTCDDFEPFFSGWSYEERRVGAFHHFPTSHHPPSESPLVSILIRTCERPGTLRQAIQSVVNQTWSNVEVIVVEDGFGEAASVCREFVNKIKITHHQHFPRVGRSAAGNTALALASGDWFCFLDDDDLLFADHLEVLVQECLDKQLKGAYGLAWRVFTDVQDYESPLYHEIGRDVFPYEPFNRLSMWDHNLFPIQAAVFHRSLYTLYGGFDISMDQLEDWNLWTRYTLNHDFVLVEKVTSCYRVPSRTDSRLSRHRTLDLAYASARDRQNELAITMTVGAMKAMLESSATQATQAITVSRFKRFVRNNIFLLALYRRLQVMRR